MFHVINLETGKPLEREPGEPHVYETGQEAARVAADYSAMTGAKHQPRRVVVNIDWRARERERMASGAYLPIPAVWSRRSWWNNAVNGVTRFKHDADGNMVYNETTHCWEVETIPGRLADHFAHPSTAKDGMVAFTESEEHGAQDRQTRLTPGRYLTRYFSDVLSAEEISRLAALYSAEFEEIELKITQDADEIERVYTNGPHSCMSHRAGYFNSPCHPTRVYAGPDLGVAFIEPSSGISARAVVWPERKIYSRVYGDEARLVRLLNAAGYQSGSLNGARIRKIEADNGEYVMPYVDYVHGADVDGKYIVLGRGPLDTQRTDGLSGENYSWHCDRCEEGMSDDDCSTTVYGNRYGEQSWCEHCAEHYAFYCEGTNEHYNENRVERIEVNGRTYCEEYAQEHFAQCEATEVWCDIDDTVTLEDGTVWSASHFARHGHQCDKCGCCYDKDDIQCDCADEETDDAQEDDTGAHRRTFSSIGHIARQGRDESPYQTEFDYSGDLERERRGKQLAAAARVGDYVRVASDGTYLGGVVARVVEAERPAYDGPRRLCLSPGLWVYDRDVADLMSEAYYRAVYEPMHQAA